jgi:predicted ATPase
MTGLERFKVRGLRGKGDVEITFKDGILIMIGENGSGKTTLLRLVFCFLSGRWAELIQIQFEEIIAHINGHEFRLQHRDLKLAAGKSTTRWLARLPSSLRPRISQAIQHGSTPAELSRLAAQWGYRMPPGYFDQITFAFEEDVNAAKNLPEMLEGIRRQLDAQILYLPTYRRIERELHLIFEGMEAGQQSLFTARQKEPDPAVIELVEFGMQDVIKAVDDSLGSLRDFARTSLQMLTLRYLGSIVDSEYQDLEPGAVAAVPESSIVSVIDRMKGYGFFTDEQITRLRGVINQAVNGDVSSFQSKDHTKIIMHYFSKLLTFQNSLQIKEEPISKFCDVCTRYLVNKQFVYDTAAFEFSIRAEYSDKVTLSELSSGEKQIVSLFSHLYLSGRNKFFVLIDEPELSLSVPWQRNFLVDVTDGGFCAGLFAVTHSPFIYDNKLKPYARSIGEFTGL